MITQKLNIKVTNAFSNISCQLEVDPLLHKQMAKKLITVSSSDRDLQAYQLIVYCCRLMQKGKTSILINNFFSQLKQKSPREQERINNRLHQVISDYLKDQKGTQEQFILLEQIGSKCFLELAPLEYWKKN